MMGMPSMGSEARTIASRLAYPASMASSIGFVFIVSWAFAMGKDGPAQGRGLTDTEGSIELGGGFELPNPQSRAGAK